MRTVLVAMLAVVVVLVPPSLKGETTTSQSRAANSVGKKTNAASTVSQPRVEKPLLTVYYFHGHVRCTNCINFEHWTDEVLKRDFEKELASGLIEWKVVNVDLPENNHFVDEFKLYTKSLVLVPQAKQAKRTYKNLTDIWKHAGDKAEFQSYVRQEIQKALQGGK